MIHRSIKKGMPFGVRRVIKDSSARTLYHIAVRWEDEMRVKLERTPQASRCS